MSRYQKSPPEKKSLEYARSHFTRGWHSSAFPKTWKRKKKLVNHEYRRKSGELLAQLKPGLGAEDAILLSDHLTESLFRRSVLRKRLEKSGTVNLGEKVRRTLANREERVDRKRKFYEPHDRAVAEAVTTLISLRGDKLASVLRRANEICEAPYTQEIFALRFSADPIDRAVSFLQELSSGVGNANHHLCRNPELREALAEWLRSAHRLLAKHQRIKDRKDAEKRAAGQRVNVVRRTPTP